MPPRARLPRIVPEVARHFNVNNHHDVTDTTNDDPPFVRTYRNMNGLLALRYLGRTVVFAKANSHFHLDDPSTPIPTRSYPMGITCLLTGVAGFVGSHLAEQLLVLGHRVVGVDDLSTRAATQHGFLPSPPWLLLPPTIRGRTRVADRTCSAASRHKGHFPSGSRGQCPLLAFPSRGNHGRQLPRYLEAPG